MQHYSGTSTFYGKLPEIYDLFFLQNCDQQIAYLLEIMRQHGRANRGRCLDVGCGTGVHAKGFAEAGWKVSAIDLSEDMLKWAVKNHSHPNIQYGQADITKFYDEEKYDVAVALSHVIGYQWKNEQVEAMLKNIHRSLTSPEGILLFNFYHAPAVQQSKLHGKLKQVKNEKYIITRISNAINNLMDNVLEEEYYYLIEEKEQVSSVAIQEKMRYFSLLEIEYFLKKSGFYIEKAYNYLTTDNLSPEDWNGFIVARKLE